MREFIESHFDKLILLFVTLTDRALIAFITNDKIVAWLERADDMVLGALIAIITGRTAMKSS